MRKLSFRVLLLSMNEAIGFNIFLLAFFSWEKGEGRG